MAPKLATKHYSPKEHIGQIQLWQGETWNLPTMSQLNKENKTSKAYNEMIEKNKNIKNLENSNNLNKENYIIAEININRLTQK